MYIGGLGFTLILASCPTCSACRSAASASASYIARPAPESSAGGATLFEREKTIPRAPCWARRKRLRRVVSANRSAAAAVSSRGGGSP